MLFSKILISFGKKLKYCPSCHNLNYTHHTPHERGHSAERRHLAGLITWSLFLGLDTTLIIWHCTCHCRRRRRRALLSVHFSLPKRREVCQKCQNFDSADISLSERRAPSTGQTPLEVSCQSRLFGQVTQRFYQKSRALVTTWRRSSLLWVSDGSTA